MNAAGRGAAILVVAPAPESVLRRIPRSRRLVRRSLRNEARCLARLAGRNAYLRTYNSNSFSRDFSISQILALNWSRASFFMARRTRLR